MTVELVYCGQRVRALAVGGRYALGWNFASVEAAGCKFQNFDDPLLLNMKPLRNFIDGGTGFEVLEHHGDR